MIVPHQPLSIASLLKKSPRECSQVTSNSKMQYKVTRERDPWFGPKCIGNKHGCVANSQWKKTPNCTRCSNSALCKQEAFGGGEQTNERRDDRVCRIPKWFCRPRDLEGRPIDGSRRGFVRPRAAWPRTFGPSGGGEKTRNGGSSKVCG